MATVTSLSAAGGSEVDPPKDHQVIEDAIRGSAGRKRVSLSRLAKDAHVQRQTIYNWFEGVVPEPETWDRVAKRLVSALTRQSVAIEGLVAELAQTRADQREATDALLQAMASAVPVPRGKRVGSGRALPDGSRR